MSKLKLLEYNGEKVLFTSLSDKAKDELISLPNSPFKEVNNLQNKVKFYLDRGYLLFSEQYQKDKMLKINENTKGKFIRLYDNVIYLETILNISKFCLNQEENVDVKRSVERKQSIAIFKTDLLDIKKGKKIPINNSEIFTSLGTLKVKKLEKEGIIETMIIPIYNGSFISNPYSNYNMEYTIRFDGQFVHIGCLNFITSSLIKLIKPLKEYLGK